MRGANSAPTLRVVEVVELLARSGDDPLRYTDISRELGLSQATTHAILKTLCDRGWASRDPVSKTFALGPGLAFIAEVVTMRPFARVAHAAAIDLAAEFGYAASVSEKVGDALVITAFEGGENPWPGDSIPYAPPFGAGFAAWDTDEGRRAWIQRAASAGTETAARLEEALDHTRERGFDVDYTSPALADAAGLVDTLASGAIALPAGIRGTLDRLRAEFSAVGFPHNDSGREPVAAVAAPVFDRQGRVVCLLSVHPLVDLPGRKIDAIGQRLLGLTTAIGASIGTPRA
ncbi:helix-turn-helix domain-containing protein [Streptomyces acidiscabies]|uniref:helix-turn-helix domain-containing protein n=1 Tax=Streptomyces acidiscabies TaxID=42234 RepID=UPI00073E904E|nr:helix-turn-helix domain-containing protein [Streptomyces acidiscabies]GAQ57570.1 IclR helix-turn-helix domain protein [Streptomyces acidiscabies]